MKIILILLLCLFLIWGCSGKKNKKEQEISFMKNSIKMEKTFIGELLGINPKKNQFIIWDYINSELKDKNIFNVFSFKGNFKKRIELDRGNIGSPIDISTPTYLQFLNDKYYIYDEYSKIIVFDINFKYLYSTRFHLIRNSIDFFEIGEKLFFVIVSRRKYKRGNKYEVFVKSINKNHLIEDSLFISSFSYKISPALSTGVGGKNYLNFYYFLPSVYAFEKNNKIYYSFSKENKYYIFDLKSKKINEVNVPSLKGRLYSAEDAHNIGFYRSTGWERKMKKRGTYIRYLPYEEKIFHLGFWDVGENTIAFVNFINTELLSIQIDIINSQTGKYIKSINTKIGTSFIKGISSLGAGFHPTFFNFDKLIYIWQDKDSERFENQTYFRVYNIIN